MSEENPRKAPTPRKKAEKEKSITKGELERRVAELEAANAALRAEEVLRESKERFHLAQELSPNGFTILRPLRDPSGSITDFEWVCENDAVARLNNTDPKEVAGRRVSELSPTHGSTPFHELYKRVIETGAPDSVEAEYKTERMANSAWIRVTAVPIGGDVAIVGQDITERRQMEEEHRNSERLLRDVIDGTSSPIFLKDAEENSLPSTRRWRRCSG